MFASLAHDLWDVSRRAVGLVPVFVGIQDYFGTVASVSGRSMQPTFNSTGTGDWLLLDKRSGRARNFGRGDVIVMRSPVEPDQMLTKRVLGLEGDLVYTRDGERELVQVPRGHLWVEGDNEHNSNDSNSFGSVAVGLVEAKVVAKVYPLAEAGAVQRVPPPKSRVIPGSRQAAAD